MDVTRKVECKGKEFGGGWIECGCTIYDSTIKWNDDTDSFDDVWQCNNCMTYSPRVTRSRRTDTITPSQHKWARAIKSRGESSERAEWAKFNIELMQHGDVVVTGDLVDPTRKEEYCSTTSVQIFISRHGKIDGHVSRFGDERKINGRDDLYKVYR